MNLPKDGQSGAPPPDLDTRPLPLLEIQPNETLSRIHRLRHDPVFYSPPAGDPPEGRFDSPNGLFGVLCAAFSFAGAFVETLLRDPSMPFIAAQDLGERGLVALTPSRLARLVDLRGPDLQRLGLDTSISVGRGLNCGRWSEALFLHPERPDGIAYRSRFDPGESCAAIFQRADLSLVVAEPSRPLISCLPDVANLLLRYGKGLVAN
jgi:hypothetical protein